MVFFGSPSHMSHEEVESAIKKALVKIKDEKPVLMSVVYTRITDMKRGEIYKGTKTDRYAARHPILFFEAKNDDFFIGGVLTHALKPDNVLMKIEHFKVVNGDNKRYDFRFSNTRLVMYRFIKPEGWGPYTKVGELTEEGINFIDSIVSNQDPRTWKEYTGR